MIFCASNWIPEDSFLKISFTDSISYVEKNETIFRAIKNISFQNAINLIEKEFKRNHIRIEKLSETPFRIEFMISGDVTLNFIKVKIAVRDI